MAKLTDIELPIDTKLTEAKLLPESEFLTLAEDIKTEYLKDHVEYQHIPKSRADTVTDKLSSTDFIQIDEYVTPDKQRGLVLRVSYVDENRVEWEKSQNIDGPEEYMTQDWTKQ